MNIDSREARNIQNRLFEGILIDHPRTYTIESDSQEYYRTVDDVLVRHDLASDLYYVLDRSATKFIHASTPLPPDTTRPFNETDLLRSPGWAQWAYQIISTDVPKGAGAALGGAMASAGLAYGHAFIAAHPATALGAAIGVTLGIPPPVGAAVTGGAIALTGYAVRRARNPNP